MKNAAKVFGLFVIACVCVHAICCQYVILSIISIISDCTLKRV